jgi:hypothetical protein
MTIVKYEDIDGSRTLTTVRRTTVFEEEGARFLKVWYVPDAPEDMGWYDALHHHGYNEYEVMIPIDRVIAIEEEKGEDSHV